MSFLKKDNKYVIAAGIGALALGLVGTLFFVTTDMGKTPLIKKDEPVVVDSSIDEKKDLAKAEKTGKEVERVVTAYTSLISPVGFGVEEFPVEKGMTLKEKLLNYAESGEVDKLLAEMERKLEGYRFSEGVNLEIAGLYYDASFTRGLVGKTENEMKELLPNTYKTPEMLALMPLYLPETARRDVIRDNLSLTPLTEGGWDIRDYSYIKTADEADEDEVYADNGVATSMFNVVDGLHQIHVIELSRDEEPDVLVRAYISELANGQLQLYGYYIPDGITHYYQTITYFQELDEMYLEPNEKHQEEWLKKELEAGNIPKEALEEFLDPTNK